MRPRHQRRAARLTPQPPSPARALLTLAEGLAPDRPGLSTIMYCSDPADGGGEIEIGVQSLPGHPLEHLTGLEAGPDWLALAVRATATAHDLSGTRGPARVVSNFAVGADGEALSSLVSAGGQVADPGRGEGLIPDACLRVFRLPTPPPPPTTDELWTAIWLDRIAATFTDPWRRRQLGRWSGVVALHPAGDAGRLAGSALEAARLHADRWPWRELRRAPGLAPQTCLPQLGEWWDDGSFARRALAALPPAAELLREFAPLLDPEVGRQLQETAGALLGPREAPG